MALDLFRIPAIVPWFYPNLIWRVPTNEKQLYLTFDDGPVPGPTEFVLNTLAQFHAKATFFTIGDNIRKHPTLFQEILHQGHRYGNHTAHHLNGWKASNEEYLADVAAHSAIADKHFSTDSQLPTALFRPPYGRIRRSQASAIRKNYSIVMWDVLTHDYNKNINPERSLRGSIRATRPGSIIVFHDSYKAEKSMTFILPRFIEHFSALGYSFQVLPPNL